MFHRGFNHSKTIKALSLRPRAFISFLVFETPMKHLHSFLKYYVWRVQGAHLHNAVSAFSSPSRRFQLWRQMFISTSLILWQKTNRMWYSLVCALVDNDTRHYSGQNVAQQIELHHKARASFSYWVRQQHTPWLRIHAYTHGQIVDAELANQSVRFAMKRSINL